MFSWQTLASLLRTDLGRCARGQPGNGPGRHFLGEPLENNGQGKGRSATGSFRPHWRTTRQAWKPELAHQGPNEPSSVMPFASYGPFIFRRRPLAPRPTHLHRWGYYASHGVQPPLCPVVGDRDKGNLSGAAWGPSRARKDAVSSSPGAEEGKKKRSGSVSFRSGCRETSLRTYVRIRVSADGDMS